MNASTDTRENPAPRRRLEPLAAATASLGLKDTRVVMRLVREGRLKAVTIGRRVFITTASLDRLAK